MWFIILLHKIWESFKSWRIQNKITWFKLTSLTTIITVFFLCGLGVVISINSCLDRFAERQKIEAVEETLSKKISPSDHIRKGEKVKVTIQTKDGPQSFEGIFVERYSNIIGIKTDKGKVAFGGSFVVEEIK